MRDPGGIGLEEDAPVAHSLLEERLYLLTIRCECGGGPLERLSRSVSHRGSRVYDVVRARCPRCALERDFRFEATSFFGRFYARNAISDAKEPSSLLDRVAWLRWARLYLRALIDGAPPGGRLLRPDERLDCGLLSVRCVDEALKFFARGEHGEESLHSPGSLEAFREAPERYARIEALGLRLQAALVLAAAGVDPDQPVTRAAAPPVLAPPVTLPAKLREPVAARAGAAKKPGLLALALPPAPEPPKGLPGPSAAAAKIPSVRTAVARSRFWKVLAVATALAAFAAFIAAKLAR